MITISVIKADVGGFVGHSSSHPLILETARKELKKSKLLVDYQVTHVGDDIHLIMTHKQGENSRKIHSLAWNVFKKCAGAAKKLKLYGIGQDLLSDEKGMGVAEISFEERESEPFLVFMADKCSVGTWNFPLYKMFADPFNTPGLIVDPVMKKGFVFELMDIKTKKIVHINTPEQIYDLLALIMEQNHFIIKNIRRRKDNLIAARSTTTSLNLIAGKYVGKDDPALIVRTQAGFPAVGEALEAFTFPFLTEGWMRGMHNGPIMPVSLKNAKAGRFDGPPRVVCLGFQLAKGKLIGPRDMFDDASFDKARKDANFIADYMRRHGPFNPHTLSKDKLNF